MYRKLFLLAFFLTVIVLTIHTGAVTTEYLLPQESLSDKLIGVVIGNQEYSLYNVHNKNQEGLIVVDGDQKYATSDKIEKVFFAYHTTLYVQNNFDGIKNEYQSIYFKMGSEKNTISQKVLDIFKSLAEICINVPKLEFLEICVKPSDKLNVLAKIPLINIDNPYAVDRSMALTSYNTLGGNLLSVAGAKRVTFEQIEDFYRNSYSMQQFLETIESETGTKYSNSDILDYDNIADYASSNSVKDSEKSRERLTKLKEVERSISEKVYFKLSHHREIILSIALNDGDYSQQKSRRDSLKSKMGEVSLYDSIFTSDIVSMQSLIEQIDKEITEAENIESRARRTMDSKGIFSFVERFRGVFNWLGLLFYS